MIRSARTAILLSWLAPFAPAVTAQTVLLDGRWVNGPVVERREGFVVIDSPAGRLTFPDWQVDDHAAPARPARISGPGDGVFAARQRDLPREREREAEVRESLRPLENDVRDQRAAKDTRQLRRTCSRLESKARGARDDIERRLARQLLADAWRALAGALPAESPDERLEVAAAHFAAHRAAYDGGTGQTWKIRDVLEPAFETDPWQWGPLVELIERSEAWGVEVRWRGPWLWAHDDVTWTSSRGSVPESYRVVRRAGARVEAAPPSGPEGVLSVWQAAVRSRQTGDVLITSLGAASVYDRDASWRRLFWCPVEQRFGEESVPEKLARSRLEVWGRLGTLQTRERNAVSRFRSLVRDHGLDVDHLARKGLDRKQLFATAAGRAEVAEINDRVAEIGKALARSLQERAAMQPWFEELAELDELLARASRGERIEVPALPPK